MKRSRDIESLIVSDLFGESTEDEKEELSEALRDDSVREDEYFEMKRTMSFVESANLANDPGEEFWDSVWPEFKNRAMVEEKKDHSPWHWLTSIAWTNFWKPALQLSVVAVMLVLGIFIGKQFSNGTMPSSEDYSRTDMDLAIPYDTEIDEQKNEYLLNATESSLRRTSEMLNNFMDIGTEGGNSNLQLISNSREDMFRILDDINILRSSNTSPWISQYSPIFDEVEILIGEIAAIRGDSNDVVFEVRALQNGIRETGLLKRLNNVKFRVIVNEKK